MGFATEQFAKRLKELRDTAGLTQAQLAEELKVSRGAISYYEKGERTPDIEFLDSLARYFMLPYDFILGATNNIKSEHKNMFESYGLTDIACDKLDCSPEKSLGRLISTILEHKNFLSLKYAIEKIIKNYRSFNCNELGYISFLLTDTLNRIIFDAIDVLIDSQFTPEEKEKLRLKHELSEKEWNDKVKEWDLRKKAFLEWSAKDEANLEAIDREENKLRYSAIDKVHEKFYETILDMEIDRYF